jgi:hypothetical protein
LAFRGSNLPRRIESAVSAAARPARFLAERSTSRYATRPMPFQRPISPLNGGDLNDLIDFFAGKSI